MAARVVFHTITDERFAVGTIALINSLRITGHQHPLTILDTGLRADQRRLLSGTATIIPYDRTKARNPTLFKPFPYLTSPSGVVVLLDSDMVVTASLNDVLEAAEAGAICAFPDPEVERWFAEWQSLFGLRVPLRRAPYVNAGFIAFSADRWPKLLERWWELCRQIWDTPTLYEQEGDSATAQGDQDALNALLMSEVPPGSVRLLDPDLAPAAGALGEGVDVVDLHRLQCRYRGKETVLLHNAGKAKPWIPADWVSLRRTAYVRLLRRLVTAGDLELDPVASDLAPWLRPGPLGQISMLGLNAILSPMWRLGSIPIIQPLARRIRRALTRRSDQPAG